jgi:hypothetical protein
MENNLFSITKAMTEIIDAALDEDVKQETIEQLNDLLINKVDGCVMYFEQLNNQIAYIVEKQKEVAEYKKRLEKKAAKFEEYVNACLKMSGKELLQGEIHQIKKRKPSKVVSIVDENLIPAKYWKIPEAPPKLQLAELKNDLKKGEAIDGAQLVDGKESLKIGRAHV